MFIVCGGTRDISSIDTNKALRCFKQFAMKTSNTMSLFLMHYTSMTLRKNCALTKK